MALSGAPSQTERGSPLLDRHDRSVVRERAPQRKSYGVADPDRLTKRRRRRAEARGPRGQQPADLLVRDHQQLRVGRADDAASLPLLLPGARARAARRPLALEPLNLRAGGVEDRKSVV